MHRRHNRAISHKRKTSFKASNWAPVLTLGGVVAGILAVVAVIVLVILPLVLPLIGVSYTSPLAAKPTPTPTPRPSPSPNPLTVVNPSDLTQEVVLTGYAAYYWFGDPFYYDGQILLTAGKLYDDGSVRMDKLLFYEPETRAVSEFPFALENDHYLYPAFNERWLVYLDGGYNGGGLLMAYDRTAVGAVPTVIKEIYTGQPQFTLDGDYIVWTERTGSQMDKLFVCYLPTMETATLDMFSHSAHGQSRPYIDDGVIVWANVDTATGSTADTSGIYYIAIGSSTIDNYSPGTYVHDPRFNGTWFAWLDGPHGPDAKLYVSLGGEPVEVASGVVDFGLGSDFAVYCVDETIYAYTMSDGQTFRISGGEEKTMYLGTSNDAVFYMDVSIRDRDVLKFALIP